MTYDEAVAWLDAKIGYGMRPGTERIRALMELLDEPQRTYPVIHVAGTNGKFSVAAMTTAILGELGLRVGTYTSPHLESVTERIAIAGEPIEPDDLAALVEYMAPFVDLLGDPPTYFETLTALAFERFSDQVVHAAVVECGLGGEYDATNVADATVSVITRVAADHLDLFGTLEKAAWEKAGIVKPDSIAVSGVEQPELAAIVSERAQLAGARLLQLGPDVSLAARSPGVGGQLLAIRGIHGTYDELFLPVHGAHQATNAVLALVACEAFAGEALDVNGVRAAFGSLSLPARCEVVSRRPLVVVDGAHNPDSAAAVLATVLQEFAFDKLIAVVGMLEDKDVEGVVGLFKPAVHRFVATSPDDERAADASRVAAAAGEADVVDNVADAVRHALDVAGSEDLVLVVGSLYTAGEARASLRRAGLLPQS